MNINNVSQNLKKLMKETFASRSVNFASQGLILSKKEADVVRNVFLIFQGGRNWGYRGYLGTPIFWGFEE